MIDWDDSKTHLSDLKGTAPGAAKSGGDKLWEDNWDDDDIEDDFSVQLRYVTLSRCLHSTKRSTNCFCRSELTKKDNGESMQV